MLHKAIPGLLLLWCVLSFSAELGRTLGEWDQRAIVARSPSTWRVGNQQLDRLGACLEGVRGRVPPGSVIAFASAEGAEPEQRHAFFRARWAAYLLPEHDVLSIDDPSAPDRAEYVVDYRAGLSLPQLELMAQLHGCRLFQVRRPVPLRPTS